MAPEVQQIHSADISVEGDQVQVLGCGNQHHHSSYIHVRKVDPQVGLPGVERVAFAMGGNEMPPAGGFVLPANQVQRGRIIEAGRGKVLAVHRDPIQLGNCAPCPRIRVADEVTGHLQHGPVKSEIGVKSCALAQHLETLRDPA
jgi:hypothetical protein